MLKFWGLPFLSLISTPQSVILTHSDLNGAQSYLTETIPLVSHQLLRELNKLSSAQAPTRTSLWFGDTVINQSGVMQSFRCDTGHCTSNAVF